MRRLLANGKVTNYEMAWLRENVTKPHGTRWQHLWASLSTSRHPRSLVHWQEMNDELR